MKISGVLAIFPLTIVLTFYVLQQQTTLERPFERHAGAYTDVAHLLASIKNAGAVEKKKIIIPATLPRRKEKITISPSQITVAQADKKIIKNIGTLSQQDTLLENIWLDHVSTNQAATESSNEKKMAATTAIPFQKMSNNLASNDQGQGLLSPQLQKAIAQQSPQKPNREVESANGFSDASADENAARLDVMVLGADIDGKTSEIESVEFAPLADENNIIIGEKGRFTFEYQLANPRQILAGVFTAKNYVTTRVDLPLELGSYGSLVPMISIHSMDKFLRDNKINDAGGFIIVDLDQEIIDVELDRYYQQRIYFDSNFKQTEADDSARFVMFAGVKPGNVMLRYLAQSRQIIERVGLVVPDQILYDLPIINSASTHSFGLYEMESLSLTPRELAISGRNIRAFNRKKTAVQESLNFYTLEFAESIIGARRYTEVDHLGTTFYVGHSGQDRLVVPGQGFLNEVLAFHQMDRLERDCLIQVNLAKDKELFEVHMTGEGSNGPLVLDESYLNRDGTVSIEATEFSTHAFVVGDMQGRIHMRLDYVDGSLDFVNSYCAAGAYLVEHL